MTNETQKQNERSNLESHLIARLEGRKQIGGAPFISSKNVLENFMIRGVLESKLNQVKPAITDYFKPMNLQVGKTLSGDMSIYDGPTERFWLTITEEEDNSYESRNCKERPYELYVTLAAKQ